MAAREAVQPGDCLVALPRESALLATPGQRCPFPDWVDAAFWNGSTWCAPHPAAQGSSCPALTGTKTTDRH